MSPLDSHCPLGASWSFLFGPGSAPHVKFKDLEAMVVSHIIRDQVYLAIGPNMSELHTPPPWRVL